MSTEVFRREAECPECKQTTYAWLSKPFANAVRVRYHGAPVAEAAQGLLAEVDHILLAGNPLHWEPLSKAADVLRELIAANPRGNT